MNKGNHFADQQNDQHNMYTVGMRFLLCLRIKKDFAL